MNRHQSTETHQPDPIDAEAGSWPAFEEQRGYFSVERAKRRLDYIYRQAHGEIQRMPQQGA